MFSRTNNRGYHNKNAKSKYGYWYNRFSNQLSSVSELEKTSHKRTEYHDATLQIADLTEDCSTKRYHKDLCPTEVQKSESFVSITKEVIESFLNPFTISDKEKLYCISSRVAACSEVEHDVEMADSIGKVDKEKFISDRIMKGKKYFE